MWRSFGPNILNPHSSCRCHGYYRWTKIKTKLSYSVILTPLQHFSCNYLQQNWLKCPVFSVTNYKTPWLIVGPIGYRPIPGIFLLLLLLLGPVSNFRSQSLIYHIQASGTSQPIHFLKVHDVSCPNTDENTNIETKTMKKTKTPRE